MPLIWHQERQQRLQGFLFRILHFVYFHSALFLLHFLMHFAQVLLRSPVEHLRVPGPPPRLGQVLDPTFDRVLDVENEDSLVVVDLVLCASVPSRTWDMLLVRPSRFCYRCRISTVHPFRHVLEFLAYHPP